MQLIYACFLLPLSLLLNLPMERSIQIKKALISVFNKEKLKDIIESLSKLEVEIYSTGGTAEFIETAGINVSRIETLTGYPSILGGRVKTLHPKVFGGILGRRELENDLQEMEAYDLPSFDLIIVDLYPFEETLKQTNDEKSIIEKIDIGGVSLIRAAAKNFRDVLVVASKSEYDFLIEILTSQHGNSLLGQRKYLAKKAFELTSHYDTAIFSYFNIEENFHIDFAPKQTLRYGENPHQQGFFFGKLDQVFDKKHGKELSYNNLVDIESALLLMEDFKQELAPVFAILKHTNTSGIATGATLSDAWEKALAADPVSAFGGVLICNQPVDLETAYKINTLFFEVLIAPGFENEALTILQTKKNRILLQQIHFEFPETQFKSLLNGVLVQQKNIKITDRSQLQFVTELRPNENEIKDLLFAEKIVKHLKSNGIAIVKNQQLIACGTGQTSRVDALNQAIEKATHFGFKLQGAVMASEAFFPFPDCVERASNVGINAIIQPGGSIKDVDSITSCNAHKISMVLTGIRHFKH